MQFVFIADDFTVLCKYLVKKIPGRAGNSLSLSDLLVGGDRDVFPVRDRNAFQRKRGLPFCIRRRRGCQAKFAPHIQIHRRSLDGNFRSIGPLLCVHGDLHHVGGGSAAGSFGKEHSAFGCKDPFLGFLGDNIGIVRQVLRLFRAFFSRLGCRLIRFFCFLFLHRIFYGSEGLLLSLDLTILGILSRSRFILRLLDRDRFFLRGPGLVRILLRKG